MHIPKGLSIVIGIPIWSARSRLSVGSGFDGALQDRRGFPATRFGAGALRCCQRLGACVALIPSWWVAGMLELYGCFTLERDRLHVYNNEADFRWH